MLLTILQKKKRPAPESEFVDFEVPYERSKVLVNNQVTVEKATIDYVRMK
jgi:hypothetical protein